MCGDVFSIEKERMIAQPTVTTDFQKGSHVQIQQLA